MATVIFAGHSIGAIVLPLMLFHQIQLMTCAVLAQRYARRLKPDRTMPDEGGRSDGAQRPVKAA
jgi:sodium/bile acid cotransporter 7